MVKTMITKIKIKYLIFSVSKSFLKLKNRNGSQAALLTILWWVLRRIKRLERLNETAAINEEKDLKPKLLAKNMPKAAKTNIEENREVVVVGGNKGKEKKGNKIKRIKSACFSFCQKREAIKNLIGPK